MLSLHIITLPPPPPRDKLEFLYQISMFFPPSSNSPEANFQNKSSKVIDLSTTDLAYQGFKILAGVRIKSESNACWFLFVQTLLITNNKKREAAPKTEAGGDEKHLFCFVLFFLFFTWPYSCLNVFFQYISTRLSNFFSTVQNYSVPTVH